MMIGAEAAAQRPGPEGRCIPRSQVRWASTPCNRSRLPEFGKTRRPGPAWVQHGGVNASAERATPCSQSRTRTIVLGSCHTPIRPYADTPIRSAVLAP